MADTVKLKLNIPFRDLQGKQVEYEDGDRPTVADRLAVALVNSQEKNSMKLFDWSIDLYKEKEIEVDDSDYEYIKDFVEKSDILRVLDKGQILKAMVACERASKPKGEKEVK